MFPPIGYLERVALRGILGCVLEHRPRRKELMVDLRYDDNKPVPGDCCRKALDRGSYLKDLGAAVGSRSSYLASRYQSATTDDMYDLLRDKPGILACGYRPNYNASHRPGRRRNVNDLLYNKHLGYHSATRSERGDLNK